MLNERRLHRSAGLLLSLFAILSIVVTSGLRAQAAQTTSAYVRTQDGTQLAVDVHLPANRSSIGSFSSTTTQS